MKTFYVNGQLYCLFNETDYPGNYSISKLNYNSWKMDIEKTFDSLDHAFLIFVLKKFGFGNKFVSWIEALISRQESCLINGENTTH